MRVRGTTIPDTEGVHEIANTEEADRVADIVFMHWTKSRRAWMIGISNPLLQQP